MITTFERVHRNDPVSFWQIWFRSTKRAPLLVEEMCTLLATSSFFIAPLSSHILRTLMCFFAGREPCRCQQEQGLFWHRRIWGRDVDICNALMFAVLTSHWVDYSFLNRNSYTIILFMLLISLAPAHSCTCQAARIRLCDLHVSGYVTLACVTLHIACTYQAVALVCFEVYLVLFLLFSQV